MRKDHDPTLSLAENYKLDLEEGPSISARNLSRYLRVAVKVCECREANRVDLDALSAELGVGKGNK